MKKRIVSLLLAFVLLLSVPAYAVDAGTGNFVRSKTYSGQFFDLTESSTFYSNVSALYEYGLSVGKTDGSFGLKDSVTVSQVIIFAGRIRSLYETGSTETGADGFRQDGQSVCQPYLLYLQSEGVLGTELDSLLYTAATRAQVAHVLASALPDAALPAANQELVTQAYASLHYITDVTEYTPYYQDILKLYRCGVSMGSDATGTYYPAAAISRGALAAMLTRMVDASLRVTPSWDLSKLYSAAGITWSDLIDGSPAYIAAPYDETAIDQDVAYMLSQGSNTLSLYYGTSVSSVFINQVMNQALSEVKSYCEQCYNCVNCSYDTTGALSLTFGAVTCSDTQLSAYRTDTLSAAIAVHDALWKSGQLTASMTEKEKARVYYTWICQNCTYDYSAGDDSLSHIAYALFQNGSAVCDGYTGAYNLLLKLEGIDCWALSNYDHIWTVAELDGTQYHIDTTWGDSDNSAVDYTFFAMTAAQSWNYHSW